MCGPQQTSTDAVRQSARLAKFHVPEIVFGPGSLAELGHCALRLGGRRPFLVTDPGLMEAGWVDEAVAHLRRVGLRPVVWCDVTPNPKDHEVQAGFERYAESGCDVIVGVGGGSVIDTPIVIDRDSFYFLPTHELNAGVVLLAYKMDPSGTASTRAPEPKQALTDDQWQTISRDFKWDWDMLAMPRLDHVVKGPLPGKVAGTLLNPKTDEAKERVRDRLRGLLNR